MTCERINKNTLICYSDVYFFKGFYIEKWAMGYEKLNKDLEPSKRAGIKFWKVVTEFANLTDKEQKKYMMDFIPNRRRI